MRAFLTLCYGVLCYAAFFVVFLYAIGFVSDVLVPKTVDWPLLFGPTTVGMWVVNVLLLGLFAVQHSGMARRGFKQWLGRLLPAAIERSTYVLLSSAVLALLFWQWRPLPGLLWNVTSQWAVWLLYALCAFGWVLVLTSSFVINHFDLFGLRQVWLRARGQPYAPVALKHHFFYRVVRHPLMLGFIVAFWATPVMSLGHLLFALATTGYILLSVKFLEERDLLAEHGEGYRKYQGEVPMVCPWPRPKTGEARGTPGSAY